MSSQELKDPERRAARFGAGFEKSLSAYASAAVAAGVSLLALAPSAEAKIVYTPANIDIPRNGGAVLVDLNHDGVADFSFKNLQTGEADSNPALLLASANNHDNEMWGRGHFLSFGQFASALRPGFTVGPNKVYFHKSSQGYRNWLMAFAGFVASTSWTYGQWRQAKHRYLGLKFAADGRIHYGWARFNVTSLQNGAGIQATLTGYAYETIPNKPIITGKTTGPDVVTLEPASLGHLAQGASGIPAWRKSAGSWKSSAH
jgi:hypothetical protein